MSTLPLSSYVFPLFCLLYTQLMMVFDPPKCEGEGNVWRSALPCRDSVARKRRRGRSGHSSSRRLGESGLVRRGERAWPASRRVAQVSREVVEVARTKKAAACGPPPHKSTPRLAPLILVSQRVCRSQRRTWRPGPASRHRRTAGGPSTCRTGCRTWRPAGVPRRTRTSRHSS